MEEAVSLLSSTDQLSTWELPLPGSPSKLSPGCLWVLILLPSATDLGSLQKSWKKKNPVLSIVGASMEAQFPLQFFALKKNAGVLNLNVNSGHMGITGRMIWRIKKKTTVVRPFNHQMGVNKWFELRSGASKRKKTKTFLQSAFYRMACFCEFEKQKNCQCRCWQWNEKIKSKHSVYHLKADTDSN